MTRRDEVLNLHNQGLSPDEIVEALSTAKAPLTKGEVLTKLAQCRREDPTAVRPDDVTPEAWGKKAPGKARQKEVNLVEFVKAWNKNPVSKLVAAQFGIPIKEVNRLLSHLRHKGVPLLPCKRKYDFAALRDAALSVLTEEQKAQFTKSARVLALPSARVQQQSS